MKVGVAVIVPTHGREAGLRRLAHALVDQVPHRLLVVDNGALLPAGLRLEHPDFEIIHTDVNLGFGRAVNLAAEQVSADALVITNDDCVPLTGFLDEMLKPVLGDANGSVGAGILLRESNPGVIDSAGVQADATLLPFDYLTGRKVSELNEYTPPPFGPTGGAMAISRALFLDLGGFDERFFAYHEDLDFAIRLRLRGVRTTLCRGARSVHTHSATLGSGSADKNYLMGYGRGLMLRKWSVFSPRRVLGVAGRDLTICAGQALIDRNLAGVKGRVNGLRAARRELEYPAGPLAEARGGPSLIARLNRRLEQRLSARRRS